MNSAELLLNLLPNSYDKRGQNIINDTAAHAVVLTAAAVSIGETLPTATIPDELLAEYEKDYGLPKSFTPIPIDRKAAVDIAIAGGEYLWSKTKFMQLLIALGIDVVDVVAHHLTPCTALCTAPIAPVSWRYVVDVVMAIGENPTEQFKAGVTAQHVPADVLLRWRYV